MMNVKRVIIEDEVAYSMISKPRRSDEDEGKDVEVVKEESKAPPRSKGKDEVGWLRRGGLF